MKKGILEEGVLIVDIGAKGHVIGKKDGQAYLCTSAVPGDVVTVEVRKKRKGMKEGVVKAVTSLSPDRTKPRCTHFEHCGGCNWQNLIYSKQIEYKERKVKEQIRRIGNLEAREILPILGAFETYNYRNKLEYTFINQRWLAPEEISSGLDFEHREAIGFHVPGRFDKVLKVDECHLEHDDHNAMRNFLLDSALNLQITFDDPMAKIGNLRNVVFRVNKKENWMVILVVRELDAAVRELCNLLVEKFSQISSLWVIVNQKANDSYSDCPAELVYGAPHLIESFQRPDSKSIVQYNIGPKSFFQTNSHQAERLYQTIYEWADLKGNENVYDLYTGTGSIALFVAVKAAQVVGIEYVPEAIEDAKTNAELNGLTNTRFYSGDMAVVFNNVFIEEHGKPDLIITDPPRAGMHADVVNRIVESRAPRVIYVSCDPATQARDLQLLNAAYDLIRIQPIDMFPHTSHVENIALLHLRNG